LVLTQAGHSSSADEKSQPRFVERGLIFEWNKLIKSRFWGYLKKCCINEMQLQTVVRHSGPEAVFKQRVPELHVRNYKKLGRFHKQYIFCYLWNVLAFLVYDLQFGNLSLWNFLAFIVCNVQFGNNITKFCNPFQVFFSSIL
jgi:hypothetical protein